MADFLISQDCVPSLSLGAISKVRHNLRAVYRLCLTKSEVGKALTDPASRRGAEVIGIVREALLNAKPPSHELLKHVGKVHFFHSLDVFDSKYQLFDVEGTLVYLDWNWQLALAHFLQVQWNLSNFDRIITTRTTASKILAKLRL